MNVILDEEYRDELLKHLSDAVKQVQMEQLSKEERASEHEKVTFTNDSPSGKILCSCLEMIFSHGLKARNEGFWDVIRHFCHRDLIQQIQQLKNVKTSVGRGRAWIFISLNEKDMEGYLQSFQMDLQYIHKYYHGFAMMCGSQISVVQTLISGLDYITFNLCPDVTYLNHRISCSEVPRHKHRVKKTSCSIHVTNRNRGSTVHIDTSAITDLASMSSQKAVGFVKGILYHDVTAESNRTQNVRMHVFSRQSKKHNSSFEPENQLLLVNGCRECARRNALICLCPEKEVSAIPAHKSTHMQHRDTTEKCSELSATSSSSPGPFPNDPVKIQHQVIEPSMRERFNPFDSITETEDTISNHETLPYKRFDRQIEVNDTPIEVIRKSKRRAKKRRNFSFSSESDASSMSGESATHVTCTSQMALQDSPLCNPQSGSSSSTNNHILTFIDTVHNEWSSNNVADERALHSDNGFDVLSKQPSSSKQGSSTNEKSKDILTPCLTVSDGNKSSVNLDDTEPSNIHCENEHYFPSDLTEVKAWNRELSKIGSDSVIQQKEDATKDYEDKAEGTDVSDGNKISVNPDTCDTERNNTHCKSQVCVLDDPAQVKACNKELSETGLGSIKLQKDDIVEDYKDKTESVHCAVPEYLTIMSKNKDQDLEISLIVPTCEQTENSSKFDDKSELFDCQVGSDSISLEVRNPESIEACPSPKNSVFRTSDDVGKGDSLFNSSVCAHSECAHSIAKHNSACTREYSVIKDEKKVINANDNSISEVPNDVPESKFMELKSTHLKISCDYSTEQNNMSNKEKAAKEQPNLGEYHFPSERSGTSLVDENVVKQNDDFEEKKDEVIAEDLSELKIEEEKFESLESEKVADSWEMINLEADSAYDEISYPGVATITNTLRLCLMLEILMDESENIIQLFNLSTGHSDGNWSPLYLLFTDCFIYFLVAGDGNCPYKVHHIVSYENLDYVSVGFNGQALQFVFYQNDDLQEKGKRKIKNKTRTRLTLDTADSKLTNLITSALSKAFCIFAKQRGAVKVCPPVFHDAKEHKICLEKCVKAESLSGDITLYQLVHWEDPDYFVGASSCKISIEGSLKYKVPLFWRTSWREGYFVLTSGILYQYQSKESEKPEATYDLKECGGCKRVRLSSSPGLHFEIIFRDQKKLELCGSSDEEVTEWLQHLCLIVSLDQVGNQTKNSEYLENGTQEEVAPSIDCLNCDALVPCSLLVVDGHILLCHEDTHTGFCRPLAKTSSPYISSVQMDKTSKRALVISIRRDMSGKFEEINWSIYFPCVESFESFLSALNALDDPPTCADITTSASLAHCKEALTLLDNRWTRADNLLRGRSSSD